VSSLPTSSPHDLPPHERPLSALPPRGARIAAFSSIVGGGLAGGLIGFALVDLQCSGACDVPKGIGVLIGATLACDVPKGIGVLTGATLTAAGMGVVAVLVLRALGEWKELQDKQ